MGNKRGYMLRSCKRMSICFLKPLFTFTTRNRCIININSINTTTLPSSESLTDTFPSIFNFLPLPTPRGSSKSQLLLEHNIVLLVLLVCPSQNHPSPSSRRVASTKQTGPHLSNLSLNMRGRVLFYFVIMMFT